MKDDWHRRAVLRRGLTLSALAVAGCTESGQRGTGGSPTTGRRGTTGGTRTDTPGETATGETETASESVGFYDDFEDDDYTSDPAWEAEYRENTAEVAIVDRETPAGGNMALRISDGTDEELNESPRPASVTLVESVEGFERQWTLRGQFYAADVPDGEWADDVHVAVTLPETGIELLLTPRVELLSFGGESVRSEKSVIDEGQWYAYELGHDGAGRYAATRWPVNGRQSGGLSVTADRSPPPETERPRIVSYGGYPEFLDETPPTPRPSPGSQRLTADHSFVRWQPEE